MYWVRVSPFGKCRNWSKISWSNLPESGRAISQCASGTARFTQLFMLAWLWALQASGGILLGIGLQLFLMMPWLSCRGENGLSSQPKYSSLLGIFLPENWRIVILVCVFLFFFIICPKPYSFITVKPKIKSPDSWKGSYLECFGGNMKSPVF